jgi:hypothetical protein
MSRVEIRAWRSRLNLLENTEKIRVIFREREQGFISFYEALALHMAEGYARTTSLNISSHWLQTRSAA